MRLNTRTTRVGVGLFLKRTSFHVFKKIFYAAIFYAARGHLQKYDSLAEMGIYRDNLSAIVIGDSFLSIIVIAQNSLDLSITVIAFVIYSVIADKLSR